MRRVESIAYLENTGVARRRVVLLVDKDVSVTSVLEAHLRSQGHTVIVATDITVARQAAETRPIDCVLTEISLSDGAAIDLIPHLTSTNPRCRIVVHSRYCSLPNTVSLIKAGASDVLPKPAETKFLSAVLMGESLAVDDIGELLGNPKQLRSEYIQDVYASCNRSCSKTARTLSMDRRTLQRILKRARLASQSSQVAELR